MKKKVLAILLALAMLCCFAVTASAAGLADLTATHNLTATKNITGTKKACPPGSSAPAAPAKSSANTVTSKTIEVFNETGNGAAKSTASASSKHIANTGDTGLAIAGAITSLAAAAFVLSSKKH